MRALQLVCIATLSCAGAHAADSPGTVRIAIERKVGYVIGDLIPYDVWVTAGSAWSLRKSSLPGLGSPEYWLDLRHIDVTDTRTSAGRVYRIHLVYQIFYAPIEARKRSLPGFALVFDRPEGPVTVTAPPLDVTLSPLREVVSGTGDPEANVALEPDRAAPPVSLRPALVGGIAGAAVAFLVATFMAWRRALGPFAQRRGAPFGRAARLLRRVELADAQAYTTALLTLHKAFDTTAGWHVFADDLPRFLGQQPRFATARAEIVAFFAASRLRFFGENPAQALACLPAAALSGLARQLANLERRP